MKDKIGHSIRKKMLSLLCGIVFGLYALVAVIGSREMRHIISEENAATMNMLVKQKASELNAHMAAVERGVKTLSQYIIENADIHRLQQEPAYMQAFMEALAIRSAEAAAVAGDIETVYFRPDPHVYGSTAGIFLTHREDGNYMSITPTDILKYASNDREHVGWYYEPKERGIPMWMEPYSNKNINVLMISFIIPVWCDNSFFGVVGMDMYMAAIHQVVDTIDYKNGFGFLLGQNGSLVYHREYPEGLSGVQFNESLREASRYLLSEREKKMSVGCYRWHGEAHYLVGADMQNGMVLAITSPASEVLQPLVRMRIVMVIIFLLVVMATIITMRLIMRYIIRPIGELTYASSRIARGELNIPIHHHSDDEIGKLAESIRKMAGELQEYISYIHAQAYTDAMTGVGNKAAYMDRIKLLDRKIHEHMADFAVIVFDVNGLKHVNDTLGHEIGDALISDAAKVLKTAFGDDAVYRIGGDEFIVIKEKITADYLSHLFTKYRAAISSFNQTERQYDIELSISSGYTLYGEEDEEYKTVFQRADAAMYKEKQRFYQGRNDRRQR